MVKIELTESEKRILQELIFSNIFSLSLKSENNKGYDELINDLCCIFNKLWVTGN